MMFTKDCIENYAHKRGIPLSQATKEFNTALECIEEAILDDGCVSFRDMFSIEQKIVKGRERTLNGVAYITPDKKSLTIKVGKKLKEKLNS